MQLCFRFVLSWYVVRRREVDTTMWLPKDGVSASCEPRNVRTSKQAKRKPTFLEALNSSRMQTERVDLCCFQAWLENGWQNISTARVLKCHRRILQPLISHCPSGPLSQALSLARNYHRDHHRHHHHHHCLKQESQSSSVFPSQQLNQLSVKLRSNKPFATIINIIITIKSSWSKHHDQYYD